MTKTEILLDNGRAIINKTTGVVEEEEIAIGRRRFAKKEEFIKLSSASFGVFFELSNSAQRAAEFLIFEVSRKAING